MDINTEQNDLIYVGAKLVSGEIVILIWNSNKKKWMGNEARMTNNKTAITSDSTNEKKNTQGDWKRQVWLYNGKK